MFFTYHFNEISWSILDFWVTFFEWGSGWKRVRRREITLSEVFRENMRSFLVWNETFAQYSSESCRKHVSVSFFARGTVLDLHFEFSGEGSNW
jgi:hypothetical protein